MKWLAASLSVALCQAWAPSKSFLPQVRRNQDTRLHQTKQDYNVVFRPSTNEDSFDSLKLGTARVHRYSDPASPMDDTEYIMWYHARDPSLNDADKSLPPLSTGWIGRAKSRNGLIWERDEEGSIDTDRAGVSLGLNKDSWWGFDTAHVGLGQVLLPMVSPSIKSEGGVYVMYYMGGSYEETKIAQYTEREVPDEATIKGMKFKIGAAMSQDGVTWGRIEGEDPSGACMVPYDTSDDNLSDVAVSKDEKGNPLEIPEELYCGWPEVVVNPIAATENKKQSEDKDRENFFMFYSTMLKDTKEKAIGCGVSYSGFSWSKGGIVIRPDGPLDGAGCARCHVMKKATLDSSGFWDEEGKGWIMYYEGVSTEDGKHRILAAESEDLKTWTKLGLAVDVGQGDDAWDSKGVGSPHVIRLDDGYFRMYYTGEGSDGQTAIGVAKSVDLKNWEREQAEVTFAFE